MADNLTPQQRQAVENRGGKLLVSAAAGSGKTKVLVDRLLSYLIDPVSPADLDSFLLITYTKAAAAELRSKIAKRLSEAVAASPENRHLQRQLQRLFLTKISTVHAFCADILREYAYRLDIPADFRVADENECFELMNSVMEQVLERAYENASDEQDFCAFVDTQGFGRDDRQIPEIILKVYNQARCHLSPNKWLQWCIDSVSESKISDAGETVWGQYLIADLHRYIDLQIATLQRLISQIQQTEYLEKASDLLGATIDQLSVLRSAKTWDAIVAHKDVDYGRLTLSSKCTDEVLKEQIKTVRDNCKKGLAARLRRFSAPSTLMMSDMEQTQRAIRGLVKLVKEFDKVYSIAKQRRRVMDFGDLEHKMLDLLLGKSRTNPTAIAKEIGLRFREIMVDEYQDSNQVQDAIFEALTQEKQNCFMVGDVKQSIYQFRLADPEIFLKKYNTFAHADCALPGQGRKIMLSSNFRSAGSVIQAVNDVFSTCMCKQVGGLEYGAEEKLYEGIPHQSIDEPEIELYAVEGYDDQYSNEAAFAADRITQLIDGTHYVRDNDKLRPITPEDIVILLRSPGSVGGIYRSALQERGIACVSANRVDMLQTEEIEVLIAFLETIHNPLQDIPLTAVLTSRVIGMTADELSNIRCTDKYSSIYDALLKSDSPKATAFVELLDRLRRESQIQNLSNLLMKLFSLTLMDSIYAAMPNGMERKENLQSFCRLAASYEASAGGGLARFLNHIQIMRQRGLETAVEQNTSNAVTVMSIHKSKGLEFPVVFLCGLSKAFNLESAHSQILCDKDLGLGLNSVDTQNAVRYPTLAKRAISAKIVSESISEEMRVLYVAMTRARDRLIMTYCLKNVDQRVEKLRNAAAFSEQALLTEDADCAGDWILQTALKQKDSLWSILPGKLTGECIAVVPNDDNQSNIHQTTLDKFRIMLPFVYPFQQATQTPSKQTATQIKGRLKDMEAAELTQTKDSHNKFWRQPGTTSGQTYGMDYGNAMHTVMQYIRYEVCQDVSGVVQELDRLVSVGCITQENRNKINHQQIADFFQSDIGRLLQNHKNVVREFKFSILDDATKYTVGVENEHILLQGVVDCAILDDDGIIIIDFKTDRITNENLQQVSAGYELQLRTYADALSRIYNLPVKSALLYFFRSGSFVSVI